MVITSSIRQRLSGRKDSERNVVFLDIDGVLQPCTWQNRFEHDLEQTQADIAREKGDERYLKLDKYDVGAVYYDWNKKAVENLKDLLRWCDGEIVISSDWKRYNSMENLELMFALHGLDEYITDATPFTEHTMKPEEIKTYLAAHPDLKSYVVIDDLDMEKHFRGHTVYTGWESFLTKDLMRKAQRILEYGPWWESRYYEKVSGLMRGGRLIEDYYKKVIFLDIDGVLNDDMGPMCREEGIIICDSFVRNLGEIVDQTGAEVVLTSSWRYGFSGYAHDGFDGSDKSMEALFTCIDRYQIKIAGSTPLFFNGPDGRPFEIRTWLAYRPDVEKFVILDDETFWKWNWLEPHVVCTAGRRDYTGTGLDGFRAEKAVEILGGKEEGWRYK